MKLGIALLSLCLTLGSMAQEASIPFRLIDGWAIVVEGTLGGLPHQKLLIDTGAVPSAINIRVSKRLGLSGSVRQLSLMNRVVPVESVRIPAVRLGALQVEALDMVAIDLGRIEQELGTRIDAVIGLDLLAKQNFTLDYLHKNLYFGKSDSVVGVIAFETRHEAGGTYILIPLESGGEKLELLPDTGTKDIMLFEQRLGPSFRELPVRDHSITVNAGGKDRLAEVELQSVKLGPFRRRKQKASIWSTPQDYLRSFDGLLGPTAVGATVVGFDFDRQVVSFEIR